MLFLFDIDGTLVLTGGAGLRALDRTMAELYGVVGAMDGLRADGKTDPLIVTEIFRARLGRDPTPGEITRVIDRYVAVLPDEVARSGSYRIMPGVGAALDLLEARRATIGLATGNVEHGARIKLERGALWARFPFGGFGSDAAERSALVARAIERACGHAGRTFRCAEEVFVIGDTPLDVAAAHACGARAIAVATGPHPIDALRACGADVVLETLEAFPDWLAGGR